MLQKYLRSKLCADNLTLSLYYMFNLSWAVNNTLIYRNKAFLHLFSNQTGNKANAINFIPMSTQLCTPKVFDKIDLFKIFIYEYHGFWSGKSILVIYVFICEIYINYSLAGGCKVDDLFIWASVKRLI